MFMTVAFQWLFAAFTLLTSFACCSCYVATKPKKWRSPIGVVSLGFLCGFVYCFTMSVVEVYGMFHSSLP
jgi:hypothetical protein